MKMIKILLIFYLTLFFLPAASEEQSFEKWLKDFKSHALKNNISEETFDKAMKKVVFLP